MGFDSATAIMVAQAVALLTGLGHSFWIPLTVVFVVKPDWSFTVVRSTSRFLGNLAAVVLIPLLLLAAADAPWAMIAALFAISLVAFRYFTANYIAASFGVAGTILILDQALAPNADLYVWRVAATVIGTVIGLLARCRHPDLEQQGMTGQLGSLVGDLAAWTRKVFDGLIAPATVEADELLQRGADSINYSTSCRGQRVLWPSPGLGPIHVWWWRPWTRLSESTSYSPRWRSTRPS